MARLGLCLLALFAAGVLSDPITEVVTPKLPTDNLLEKQLELAPLFYHIHEPNHIESWKNITETWSLEHNIDKFNNALDVKIFVAMIKNNWLLPRGAPFYDQNIGHEYELKTLFSVLYSAKDYQTFYKTAVYLRERINENIFVSALIAATIHRLDTQGIILPPIYEVLPEYFNNGEILTIAQRANDESLIEHSPSTYKWDENIVIRWNTTVWPYYSKDTPIWYFLQDPTLNAFYYYHNLVFSKWVGGDVASHLKERRGELFWFVHKQLISHYYMQRLSNGLGEIDELGLDVVQEGYNSGLVYYNGIPFPVRPDYFHVDQPKFVKELEKINDYERRIRDAIESGYIIDSTGGHVNIRTPEAIDILGRVIEASVDSPNVYYYKDFISIWKSVLGNSKSNEYQYFHNYSPLLAPSPLEQYWTTLRDPAFYAIWKRVLNLFELWHQQLPSYETKELDLPSVAIEKVDVDKLVTFFEYAYTNITSSLPTKKESQAVLVQQPRLNHKKFNIRVHVKSEVAKKVVVKFFLAPKYDSYGNEIPLHQNTQNFFLLDAFTHELPQGESVITRESTQNLYTKPDWKSAHELYQTTLNAQQGKGDYVFDRAQTIWDLWPERFLLPKGRVGGMPFVFLTFITEHRPVKVPLGADDLPHRLSDDILGFPIDRPLYLYQIDGLRNIVFQDVLIHHKPTPEVVVPRSE